MLFSQIFKLISQIHLHVFPIVAKFIPSAETQTKVFGAIMIDITIPLDEWVTDRCTVINITEYQVVLLQK